MHDLKTMTLLKIALIASLGLTTSPLLAEDGGAETLPTESAESESREPACGDHLKRILELPERPGHHRTDLSRDDLVVLLVEGPRGGQVIMGCTAAGRHFHGTRLPDQNDVLGSWKIGVVGEASIEELPTYDEYDFPGSGEIRSLPPRPPRPPRCGPRPRLPARPGRIRIPRLRPGQICPDFAEPPPGTPDDEAIVDDDLEDTEGEEESST